MIRGLILAALAGVAGGLWYAHSWVSPESVRAALIATLGDQFADVDVHVGSARMRLFGGISVRDLRLTRRGDAEPFFAAPAAVIYHDKEQLNRGRLVIRKVELDGPHLRLERAPDGTWNVAGLARPAAPDRPVPTFVVTKATVTVTDAGRRAAAGHADRRQAQPAQRPAAGDPGGRARHGRGRRGDGPGGGDGPGEPGDRARCRPGSRCRSWPSGRSWPGWSGRSTRAAASTLDQLSGRAGVRADVAYRRASARCGTTCG